MKSIEWLLYELSINSIDSSVQVEVHNDFPELGDTQLRVYHKGGYSFLISKIFDGSDYIFSFSHGETEFKNCDLKMAIKLMDETRDEKQKELISMNLTTCFVCPSCESLAIGDNVDEIYEQGVRYKNMKHMSGVFCQTCYEDEQINNSSL